MAHLVRLLACRIWKRNLQLVILDCYKKQLSQVTLADVKKAVIDDINARVKNAIISGFVFNEKPVWLSEENQLNFAQAVAPVAMKVGEQENGTPVYISFETQADVTEFVNACIAWKMNCLSAGWAEKDAIDWTPYETALNPVTE